MTDALHRLPALAVHAGEALAIAVLGISALAIGGWLLAKAARRWGTDEVPIRPPRVLYDQADENMRKRTEQRRDAADKIRARAARVETGMPISELLRRVK